RSSGITVQYLSQDPDFNKDMTVLEHILQGDHPVMKAVRDYETAVLALQASPDNRYLQAGLTKFAAEMDALDGWNFEVEAKSILGKLGIDDIDRKIGELSGGQKKRIALAEALIRPSDLLMLDEPTNHIDFETIKWLEKYLMSRKGSLLIVTHDRYFLNRVINRIIEIDKGGLYCYEGNFEYYLESRTMREEIQDSMERRRRRLYINELAWIRRGARARTTKQKARIVRFEELKKMGTGTSGESLDLPVAYRRLGKKVVEMKNVSKSFDGQAVLKDFSILLDPADRIGIVGLNGMGKTILLDLIAGLTRPDTGEISTGETVKVAYYRQGNEDMDHSVRVIDYIRETAEYVEAGNGQRISASQMLERFLFDSAHQYSLIGNLSGGEKRRLLLAKVLIENPNVLLLDEPTNDLDIQTLEVLEEYLQYFQGAVLVISHDRYFLDKAVDRLIAIKEDGRTAFFNDTTGYERSLAIEKPAAVKKTKISKGPMGPAGKKRFTYAESREFERIDSDISTLEASLAKIEEEMMVNWSDYIRMKELAVKQKDIQTELAGKMERWVYLNELAEEINK
ncbi:MAG: ABC-F family ATP-binding cassette domain-containing protein, partial [Actinobacteria bacterium]|nr:ABC-F family ATP-binding cassette domain-containing protein [Actinomycetota bacterium]